MVDGADQVRFIQHGVVENRICASEPSQRGRAEMIFEANQTRQNRYITVLSSDILCTIQCGERL